MAGVDAVMEYLPFSSSAVFAVPRGVEPGEYVGQALFRPSGTRAGVAALDTV